jgi:hypothetical protein
MLEKRGKTSVQFRQNAVTESEAGAMIRIFIAALFAAAINGRCPAAQSHDWASDFSRGPEWLLDN